MKYIVNIKLDKTLKHDFCVLKPNLNNTNITYLYIHTNGEKEIDFEKMNYLSLGQKQYQELIKDFSSKRKIRDNLNVIYLSDSSLSEKNSKEQNEALASILKKNPVFLKKRAFVNIGSPKYNVRDLETIKPFKSAKKAFVSFEKEMLYYSTDEIEMTYEMVNEIVRKVKEYEFSPAESMLYAYDMIRTNFEANKKFNGYIKRILRNYDEPSTFYTVFFKQVLDRLNIRNTYTVGSFDYSNFHSYERAMNIVYLKDSEKEIEGIYYFDLTFSSRYAFERSFPDGMAEDVYVENFLNNYNSFCRTKEEMEDDLALDEESILGMADENFIIEKFDPAFDKFGIKGICDLNFTINNLSELVEGIKLIDVKRGIKPDELEDIRDRVDAYTLLMGNDIKGETFLDILFNVRMVEHAENREVFPLSVDTLRNCLLISSFVFTQVEQATIERGEYDPKTFNEDYLEMFEDAFLDEIENKNIEDQIDTLKLTLKRQEDKKKNDDNK